MFEGYPNTNINSSSTASKVTKKKKKTKRSNSSKRKKKMSSEQSLAAKSIHEWLSPDADPPPPAADDFLVPRTLKFTDQQPIFEMHSHSICSDGFLSPSDLVERAHCNGVKVLALTDHDTMSGIPEAMEAASKFGIRIIPGVEISTIFSPREGIEEPVHILAYYGSWGPAGFEELEKCLANIRDGRYFRAKEMLLKLNKLKMPLKWEHVTKIAGQGVAPGRLHVARALVEAGHVENLKQAFNRYLYDGGPAYATGKEPLAEDAVQLICRTGGVAALAHPWALKNPVPVIKSLKDAGLHAIEVYRSDGKVAGFSDLADACNLVKLGGSDFHGKGGHDESDLGSVKLPILAIHDFLKLARPIWCDAIKDILLHFAKDEPSDSNLDKIMRFGKVKNFKVDATSNCSKDIDLYLSYGLASEERRAVEFEALRLKLEHTVISKGGFRVSVISRQISR